MKTTLAAVLIRAEHVTQLCWMCLGMQLKSNVNVQAMTFENQFNSYQDESGETITKQSDEINLNFNSRCSPVPVMTEE